MSDRRNEPVDVIVVGAGIIGIACAYYLARAGFTVTVIDQGDVGAACSYANCGYVCPSHVLPLTEPGAVMEGLRSLLNPRAPFRVRPQARLALYRWLWQFARRCNHRQMLSAGKHLQAILEYSADEFRHLMATEDLDCEWRESGLMYVFQSPDGMRSFAKTHALLESEFGLMAERIDGDALPHVDAALKPGLAGAYLYADDASLRPDKLVTSWAAAAMDAGASFIADCRLNDVQCAAGEIQEIVTGKGPMRARHYVFATGAWSGSIGGMLGCRLPVEPGKGYSVTMTRPSLLPQYPTLLPEHRVGVTPFEDSLRLGSMMEFSGFDSEIPEFRIRQLQDAARPYLHEPVGERIEETWYGWRPMTWDSLPIIGTLPALGNALIAAGHNMLGLSMAPATGRLIADLLAGSPTAIPLEPYAPQRFD